ncbi:hypothetical protein GOV13_02900 [Candidatus Pacearchaeota archaeon]|nr:hypothetical protein [Candidatus Pacearchaeota archaeon]
MEKQESQEKIEGRKCFIGYLEKALGRVVTLKTKVWMPGPILYGERREEGEQNLIPGVYAGREKDGIGHVFINSLASTGSAVYIMVYELYITSVSTDGRECECETYIPEYIEPGEENHHEYKTKFIVGMLQESDKPDNYL